jgi:hypothetical protein
MKNLVIVTIVITVLCYGCSNSTEKKDRLGKASREDKNGWIYLHAEGSPSDIGYQHGYLLANDIDTSIQAVSFLLNHDTHRDWQFYRNAARNFYGISFDRNTRMRSTGSWKG